MELVQLSNGFRILYKKNPPESVNLVTIGLLNPNGILQENQQNLEAAHFFEHLAAHFLSKKYSDGKQNQKLLEQTGAYVNATTSNNFVDVFIEGKSNYLQLYLDYILEMFLHFDIDHSIFDQEKSAVIQELKKLQNFPFMKKQQAYQLKLYEGLDSVATLYDRIQSTIELTDKDVENFFYTFWKPENTILYASGNFDVEDLLQFTKNKFARNDKNNKSTNYPVKNIAAYISPISQLRNMQITYVNDSNVENTEVSLYFNLPVEAFDIKRMTRVFLIKSILGDGFNSRLLKRLRHQLGIIYNVSVDLDLSPKNKSVNIFEITAEVSNNNIQLLLVTLVQELAKLCRTEVSKEELKKVKNIVQTKMLHLEQDCNAHEIIEENAERVLMNEPLLSLKEKWEFYQKITPTDIKKECRKIFKFKKCWVLYSGKKEINQELEQIFNKLLK
jgi:predicted Zn-dependent peptidase